MATFNKQERIDFLESLGYEILSKDIIQGLSNKLEVKCKNGHIFQRPFKHFKNIKECVQCKYDNAKKLVENNGWVFKGFEEIYCPNGHKMPSNWKIYTNTTRCIKCSINKSINKIEKNGFKVLSRNGIYIEAQCKRGHIMKYSIYKGINCSICSMEDMSNILKEYDVKYKFTSKKSVVIECKSGHKKTLNYSQIIKRQRIGCEICKKNERDSILIGYGFKNIGKKGNYTILECENGHNFVRSFDDVVNKNCIICPICNPRESSLERDFSSFLDSIGIDYVKNYRDNFISEIDFFIPNMNIAFELNGTYWHSTASGKRKDYHLNKTNVCKNNGIDLVHIWEVDWYSKNEIVKSIVKSKLNKNNKIHARQCKVVECDIKYFLQENHLQGTLNYSVGIALIYENNIVGAMAFVKSRFNTKYKYELARMCFLKGYNICGGASKMLKYFTDRYVGSIVSYADVSLSNGNVYKKLGFKLEKINSPSYFYVKNGVKINRHSLMKREMRKKFKKYDENLTEESNAILNRFNKIWNCGTYTFYLEN